MAKYSKRLSNTFFLITFLFSEMLKGVMIITSLKKTLLHLLYMPFSFYNFYMWAEAQVVSPNATHMELFSVSYGREMYTAGFLQVIPAVLIYLKEYTNAAPG